MVCKVGFVEDTNYLVMGEIFGGRVISLGGLGFWMVYMRWEVLATAVDGCSLNFGLSLSSNGSD